MPVPISSADLAFGLAFAFLAGAFAANVGWRPFVALIVAFIIVFTLYRFKKYHRTACLVFLVSFTVGISYVYGYLAWTASKAKMPFNTKITFAAVVTDEPRTGANSIIVSAAAQPPLRGSVEILAPPYSNIHYGDLLAIQGKIEPPENTGSEPLIIWPRIVLISAHHGFWLREKMIDLKLAMIARLGTLLPADNAAFLAGVLFGAKNDINQAFKNELSVTGTTHLVAVSGYKVTLVIVAAGIFLGQFLQRRAAFPAIAVCLGLFVLMVGNAASAIRAAIMGFMGLIARETGEEFDMRNAITFAAFIMVIADPTALTNDLSFIISFASVIGIVYLGPSFQKLFRVTEPGVLEWKSAAITTLAAQLATMPILVNAFGQFSFVAIPANILTLSLLPLTLCAGFALAALSFLSYHLAFAAAKLVTILLTYQLVVIRSFAAIAISLPVVFNSEFIFASYYLVLILFIFSYGRAPQPIHFRADKTNGGMDQKI